MRKVGVGCGASCVVCVRVSQIVSEGIFSDYAYINRDVAKKSRSLSYRGARERLCCEPSDHRNMADVTTDELRTACTDTQSSNISSKSRTTTATEASHTSKTMTVDKSVKTEQSAPSSGTATSSTKLGPSGQTSNSSAPRGSPPTQMKAAPGNNMATASPKKTDSKGNSPHSKSSADPPAATKSSLQPTSQQQQLHSSVKVSPKKNPWNRNPPTSAPPTGGEGKRSHVEGQPEQKSTGRTASEGGSPLQKDPSRSIKIPGGSEVQLFMLHVLHSVPSCAPLFVCIQIVH